MPSRGVQRLGRSLALSGRSESAGPCMRIRAPRPSPSWGEGTPQPNPRVAFRIPTISCGRDGGERHGTGNGHPAGPHGGRRRARRRGRTPARGGRAARQGLGRQLAADGPGRRVLRPLGRKHGAIGIDPPGRARGGGRASRPTVRRRRRTGSRGPRAVPPGSPAAGPAGPEGSPGPLARRPEGGEGLAAGRRPSPGPADGPLRRRQGRRPARPRLRLPPAPWLGRGRAPVAGRVRRRAGRARSGRRRRPGWSGSITRSARRSPGASCRWTARRGRCAAGPCCTRPGCRRGSSSASTCSRSSATAGASRGRGFWPTGPTAAADSHPSSTIPDRTRAGGFPCKSASA